MKKTLLRIKSSILFLCLFVIPSSGLASDGANPNPYDGTPPDFGAPTVSIDLYTIYFILFGLLLAFYFLVQKNKKSIQLKSNINQSLIINRLFFKKSNCPKKHKTLLFGLITFCFFVPNILLAQVLNEGQLYVSNYGEVYVASGDYSFGAGGSTVTVRSTTSIGVNYGVLSFGSSNNWTDASNSHFSDGFIRSYGGVEFIFPVGQSGKYAPFKIIPLSVTSGTVDGAYFSSNPSSIGSALDGSVASIGNTEYWRVKSCNTSSGPACTAYTANITLTWQSTSGIATLTSSDLSNLTISGWNGSSWQRLESAVDATSILGGSSSLTSGSITTNTPIDLSQFEFFTFGNKGNTCAPLVTSSGITKTWNGSSWSPSAPTLADPVIIDGAFSGNLSCNSIVLNANITLADGQMVEIVNGATGSGRIILSAEANLVQRNASSTAPTVELTKITNPMRRYDYVFISSPINSGSAFYSDLISNQKVAVDGNYGSQPNSAFSNFKTLDASGIQQITVTTATIGQGLRALIRNQAPFSTSNVTNSWFTEKKDIYMKTSGVANNGNVQVTVPANASAFIGNPYPSAISAEKLLDAAGPNVVQTVYYWNYNTPMSAAFTYNRNDFATWTVAGGVAACSGCQVPNGKIASMQSIYIKGGSTASTFNISNCMRQTTGNDNFFRVKPKDRYWLNMTGSTGSFSQILVAYTADATLGEDAGYDGMRYGTGTTSTLSSLINTSKYAIQARPTFDINDAVPLAVNNLQNDYLTIALGNKEGIFNNGNTIYLHDKVLETYHDLTTSNYSFIQSATEDINRFEVVYQNQSLNNNEFVDGQVMAMIRSNSLEIRANSKMNFIEIFDLTGRKISDAKIDNSSTFSAPFRHAQAIYIAKIKLENGTTATVKLVDQK